MAAVVAVAMAVTVACHEAPTATAVTTAPAATTSSRYRRHTRSLNARPEALSGTGASKGRVGLDSDGSSQPQTVSWSAAAAGMAANMIIAGSAARWRGYPPTTASARALGVENS